MKLADAVVQALLALDVRYVFGVSGANIEHLHDAIHRLGGGQLLSIMTKSEVGAAFMADGYARVHRRLGVCCSTSGGGMMNLAVGIAESHAESVPVLALVGQSPARGEGRGAFQDSSGIGRTVDAKLLFNGIAKFVRKISRAEDFWPIMQRAVIEALGGRPGPAVILFPRSIWTAEVPLLPTDFARVIDDSIKPVPIDKLGADPESILQLGNLSKGWPINIRLRPGVEANPNAGREGLRALLSELRQARHPVLLVGQGLRRCSNPAAVIEFARNLRLPIIADMSARADVPNDDPLFLGMLGAAGHPSVERYLRQHADLLLIVGTGLNSMTRAPLLGDAVGLTSKKLLAVNIDLGELDRIVEPPDMRMDRSWWNETAKGLLIAVEADAGVVFEELLALWREDPFNIAPIGPYKLQILRPALAEKIAPANQPLAGTLLQSEALELLQPVLPQGGHLVYDAGNCAAAALHQLYVPPGTSGTIALGMGGMGYAIAAAVGIALGSSNDQRTFVFTGDGSLLMAGFEIHTAVEYALPILFIVFNNSMHGMCVTRQQKFFEGRLECVRYAPVDVTTLARGFGDSDHLWAGRASTAEELKTALSDYMNHAVQPGVLELILSREELPPFSPLLPSGSETIDWPPPVWPSSSTH